MSIIGETAPFNPFSQMYGHDGISAFGANVNLGHNGHTRYSDSKHLTPLPEDQQILHEDGRKQHQVGDIINIRFTDEQFEVLEIEDLDTQDHAAPYSKPNIQSGTAYLLTPVTPSAA